MNNGGRSVSSAHTQYHYLTSKHRGYSNRAPLDYKATCTLGDTEKQNISLHMPLAREIKEKQARITALLSLRAL
jgi:hypothetical protein